MYAAAKGDSSAMKILLDSGADISTIDNVSMCCTFVEM